MSFLSESFSKGFGVDGVTIEQTLLNPYDPYSGMDVNTGSFQNTNQGLLDSNQDVLLPDNITKVPALLLLNEGFKVYFGDDILTYLKPIEKIQNNKSSLRWTVLLSRDGFERKRADVYVTHTFVTDGYIQTVTLTRSGDNAE